LDNWSGNDLLLDNWLLDDWSGNDLLLDNWLLDDLLLDDWLLGNLSDDWLFDHISNLGLNRSSGSTNKSERSNLCRWNWSRSNLLDNRLLDNRLLGNRSSGHWTNVRSAQLMGRKRSRSSLADWLGTIVPIKENIPSVLSISQQVHPLLPRRSIEHFSGWDHSSSNVIRLGMLIMVPHLQDQIFLRSVQIVSQIVSPLRVLTAKVGSRTGLSLVSHNHLDVRILGREVVQIVGQLSLERSDVQSAGVQWSRVGWVVWQVGGGLGCDLSLAVEGWASPVWSLNGVAVLGVIEVLVGD
jgi:hypothetical protein